MSAPALAVIAVLAAAAALWELGGSRAGAGAGRAAKAGVALLAASRAGAIGAAALWLGVPGRLQRAGLAERVPAGVVLGAKALGATVGGLAAAVAVPVAPARLSLVVALGLPAAGFVAPEALLERAARRRRARIVAALPDALDLLAVGTAAGRSPATVLAEICRATAGPLADELAIAVAEIESGRPQREAIASLRDRNAAAGLGALAAALERSWRFGSPLADQLHAQATSLRRDARRRIEERAARAAPKIQLVVALVLVPSVLLMILAALIAHADAFFGAF